MERTAAVDTVPPLVSMTPKAGLGASGKRAYTRNRKARMSMINIRSPKEIQARMKTVSKLVIMRVYFNYGYLQLLLWTSKGETSGLDSSKSAYVTIRPNSHSTKKEIRATLIDALNKRNLKGVTSFASKFDLVDRKTRKSLKPVMPLMLCSGKGTIEAPYEVDLVPSGGPERLESFADKSYEVIKHLSMGRRQQRIMRLTSKGIQNIRISNGKEQVSSEHTYKEVFYTALLDDNLLVISYTDAKEHKYEMQGAIKVVQAINDRIAMFMRAETQFLLNPAKSLEKAEETQKTIIRHYKSMTYMGMDRDKLQQFEDIVLALQEPETKQIRKSNLRERLSSVPDARMPRKLERKNSNPNPGSAFYYNNEQDNVIPKLQLAVDAYLCGSTTECNARKRFLKTGVPSSSSPDAVCGMVRKFVDSMAAYIREHRDGDMAQYLEEVPEEKKQETIDYAIEDSLQRTIVNPLFPTVLSVVRHDCFTDDAKCCENAKTLAIGSQSDFGIASEYLMPNGWASAIVQLSMLERFNSPVKQLGVLVATARCIFSSFNEYESSKSKSGKYEPKYLSADDFFPIFLFVMCNAALKHPHLNKALMWGLCSKAQLQAEGGYYLTVYEAAVTYITDYKPEERKAVTDTGNDEVSQSDGNLLLNR
mmetsp:Transcript_9434/g.18342  ORF Transcript_9434/g.18342 Transcript_9434/m.18342 type:complete len:647 (-) Transcript_9434:135-2075(-)